MIVESPDSKRSSPRANPKETTMLRPMKVFIKGVFSLVLDIADVTLWVRGERTPSVTVDDV